MAGAVFLPSKAFWLEGRMAKKPEFIENTAGI
jgi:hypothetical protein